MKFVVAVDCEGVACAVGSPGGGRGTRVDPYTVRWELEKLSDYF